MDNDKTPSDAQFRLQCGELSAQGLRDARTGYMMALSDAGSALALLSRMRFACGDNGKRMQDELEDYMRELAKDAGRYRWLRSLDGTCSGPACVNFNIGFDWIEQHGDELDAAIDAAMAEGER